MTRERDPGQWWSEAWSPVTGCTPAGAGCDHCWARAMVRRFPALHLRPPLVLDRPEPGPEYAAPFSTVVCHPDRLEKPLHWRKPRVVLVSMLGDLFHEQVPGRFAVQCLRAMAAAQQHVYCVLTKRPRRAVEFMADIAGYYTVEGPLSERSVFHRLYFMASVWDQASADVACAAFATLPAGVRWGLHCEPLLGPIVLEQRVALNAHQAAYAGLSWVVVGGENGPGARPMDPQWALDLREQCKAAGVKFWFKGWGRWLRYCPLPYSAEVDPMEQTREVPW